MGSVFLVEHTELKTRHAIKVLLPHLSSQQQIVQRFRNEARAAAATKSPNIVAVRDFGQLENGAWYHVMDYWEGMTLGEFLLSRGPLTHEMALRITFDALNGLAAAHKNNIVHRDLKPDNLYLAQVDRDIRTMILDFGVCRLGEDAGFVTRSGAVIGTPRYMAPEQFRGQSIDHRADLWAMGAIVYEMATGGWLPYDDDGSKGQPLDDAVLHARMAYPPVDPQRRAPTMPRTLADAILKLIDPEPARRPASASASAVLLAETLAGGMALLKERAPDLLPEAHERKTVRAMSAVRDGSVAREGTTARYAIRYKIGSGGMAEVFRAEWLGAQGFARPVALKRVLPGLSALPAFATMFNEEAHIASQLSHINIVSVLDFDRDPDGRLFLAMEFVDGKDLGALLDTGRLPPAMAIFIVSEILHGLAYAHDLPDASGNIRGVVHRDISPQNVLLSWEGAVKLTDFGIAKARGAGSAQGSMVVKGKPAYMSPEQVNAEVLDGRSDLFAVGVVLWEALTGRRLFKGESPKETFGQIMFRDAPAPSSIVAGIPADLDRVVLKLLARDRSDRYASAMEAVEALASCNDNPRNGRGELVRLLANRFPAAVRARSQGRGISDQLPGIVVPASPVSTLGTAASQSSPRYSAPPLRRRRLWLLGGFAVVVGASVTLAVVTVARQPHRLDPTASAQLANAGDARETNPMNGALRVDAAVPVTSVLPDAALPDAAPPDAAPPDAAPLNVATASSSPRDAAVPNSVATTAHVDASVPMSSSDTHTPTTPQPAAADRPASTVVRAPVEMGKLHIFVVPFAQVWVDDASTSAGQTPLHLKLRAGRHVIRLENKRLNKDVTRVVTITPAKDATIDESW